MALIMPSILVICSLDRGNYFRLVKWYSYCNMKQFQVIMHNVLLPPDEINDISVDIIDDLQINVRIYNGLTHMAQL